MEHYVTLFNKNFIPQGLNLYHSMVKYCGKFNLWIVCMDDETYNILKYLNLDKATLLLVDLHETEQLRQVKQERTIGEYCWTLTPYAPQIVFRENENVKRVTYLDADIWFVKNPGAIFEEFEKSPASVLITEHDYIDRFDQSETSGIYCVQFIIFDRLGSSKILEKWSKQCLEWCYNRFEDGKFGDQKYLDTWPYEYGEKVHILKNKAAAQGPWNTTKYNIKDAVFYHFHQVRILSTRVVDLGGYPLRNEHKEFLYLPYIREIIKLRIKFDTIKVKSLLDSIFLLYINKSKNLVRFFLSRNRTQLLWIK
jgi:hypothetical protein